MPSASHFAQYYGVIAEMQPSIVVHPPGIGQPVKQIVQFWLSVQVVQTMLQGEHFWVFTLLKYPGGQFP